jgi:hypothetical protein
MILKALAGMQMIFNFFEGATTIELPTQETSI